MAVALPTPAQLAEVAAEIGLSLSGADVDSYLRLISPLIAGAYRALDAMSDELPPVKYPRERGDRPGAAENKYNAWYYKTAIKGAATGKLAGKRVVLKDNIMLAGVPMMNGSVTFEGYVPDVDATVVTRVLDAGGEIVGKAHCECLCFSAGSHTNATGPVHNPRKMGYSAGGSSSGCAVLVAAGEADMAIGGDQGGSIRIPAAFCGVYGMKPTHGLVPYTGIMPLEPTVDHTGPITGSVRDNALLLEVLAGADGYDPRQCAPVVHPYSSLLDGGVGGMKIAVVREGFSHPDTERDVDAKVRAAAARLGQLGATVDEVSIPLHVSAGALCSAISLEGLTHTLMWGDSLGIGHSDLYVTSAMDFHRPWRQRANELAETIKVALLLGTYITKHYGHRYYAKAMNLARKLTAAYGAVLARYDLLLMPTCPMKATPLPGPNATREEIIRRAFEPVANTAPFNVTHHPAMSIPCAMSHGLPIGMMLVGKHFDEPTIYRAAAAFEQAADWTTL